MPYLESYPLRAQGPRTDLSIAYLSCIINAAAQPVVDSAKTTAGYTITGTAGSYDITFKKCRFVQIFVRHLPVTGTNGRGTRILANVSPTAGTATLQISADGTLTGANGSPAAEAGVFELTFLSGF